MRRVTRASSQPKSRAARASRDDLWGEHARRGQSLGQGELRERPLRIREARAREEAQQAAVGE
ncbi:MAG: hypothetical protein ACKO4Q_11680, partial [Planctomycetota bacterium]